MLNSAETAAAQTAKPSVLCREANIKDTQYDSERFSMRSNLERAAEENSWKKSFKS